MKIYVAGKNMVRARTVMNSLIEKGHTITFDWITEIADESNLLEKAALERAAVIEADLLVYLWESDQESARYEAGMAMGLHKPIIVSGYQKGELFFLALPEVKSVKTDMEIIAAIDTLQ